MGLVVGVGETLGVVALAIRGLSWLSRGDGGGWG